MIGISRLTITASVVIVIVQFVNLLMKKFLKPAPVSAKSFPTADPAPLLQTTTASAVSPDCSLQCCDLSSPVPTRLRVDRSATEKKDNKRKRFFNSDWLTTFDWLVLCKSTLKAYCQTCRYESVKLFRHSVILISIAYVWSCKLSANFDCLLLDMRLPRAY